MPSASTFSHADLLRATALVGPAADLVLRPSHTVPGGWRIMAESKGGRLAGADIAPSIGEVNPPCVVVPYFGFRGALDAVTASAKEGGRVEVSATESHLTLRAGKSAAAVPCVLSTADTISPRLAHVSQGEIVVSTQKLIDAWQSASTIARDRGESDVLSNVCLMHGDGRLTLMGCDRSRGTKITIGVLSSEGAAPWSVLIPSKAHIPDADSDVVAIGPVGNGFLLSYPRLSVLLPTVDDPYPSHIAGFFDQIETSAIAGATEVIVDPGTMKAALASVAYVASDAGTAAIMRVGADGLLSASGPRGSVEVGFMAHSTGDPVEFGLNPAVLRTLLSNATMDVRSLWFSGPMNPICILSSNEAGEKENMMFAPCRIPGGGA